MNAKHSKPSAQAVVEDIRRATRKRYGAEEKIRIGLEWTCNGLVPITCLGTGETELEMVQRHVLQGRGTCRVNSKSSPVCKLGINLLDWQKTCYSALTQAYVPTRLILSS